MRVAFKDHRGMGLRLAAALRSAGHEIVAPLAPAELALVDHDVPWGWWQAVCDNHERVVVYPHGGGLVAQADHQHPAHPHTVALLVMGEGQAQLAGECGYDRPVYVIGNTMCDVGPWRTVGARSGGMRLLLAPPHDTPRTPTIQKLCALLDGLACEVKVRWPELVPYPLTDGADTTYGPWTVQAAVEAVAAADVVIAQDTFAAVALARGVATVMFDQSDGADTDAPAAHPDLWFASRYPADASRCQTQGDLLGCIALAANEDAVSEWRRDFVGEQFDPDAFVKLMESLA